MSRSKHHVSNWLRLRRSQRQISQMIEFLEQRRLLSVSWSTIGFDATTYDNGSGYTLVAGDDSTQTETKNTTALNDLINVVATMNYPGGQLGGLVYIPDGTYYINGPVQLPQYMTLRGESATGEGEDDGTNGAILD